MDPLFDGEQMKHEYREGPQAGENFKKLATAILQKPKTVVVPKAPPKRKTAGKNKD